MKTRYTRTAIALHWSMAFGLAAVVGLGFYMADLPLSPTKLQLYSWHKWAGVTLFLLALFRLFWRVTHRPPELPATMPALAKLAAHGAHAALYGLMLAITLPGWLMSSAKGFTTVWFGVLPLPDLVGKDAALASLLQTAHVWLNYALLALVVAHFAAALKHRLIDRDDILDRMLPSHGRP